MKPLLQTVICFTALSFPMGMHAQNNTYNESAESPIPMFALGVKWNVAYQSVQNEVVDGGYNVYDVGENHQYGVRSKEQINKKEYYHIPNDRGGMDFYGREEDGKVYVYYKQKEYLVFDYALKVGDSFNPFHWDLESSPEIETLILDAIETKEVAGQKRRIYYFSLKASVTNQMRGTKALHNRFSYTNIDREADYIWVEGIGSLEDTPSYQPLGLTGHQPSILLGYTGTDGVQYALTNHPADYSWKIFRGFVQGIDEMAGVAGADVHLMDGILTVRLQDGKPHRIAAYSLNGMCLLAETTFTSSHSTRLGLPLLVTPIVVVLDGKGLLRF